MLAVLPRSLTGLAGAAVLWLAGLAPSLLPRPPIVSVALAGLLWAVGYGVGCATATLARALVRWRPDGTVATLGAVLVGALWAWTMVQTLVAGQWQQQQADALGMAGTATPGWVVLLGGVVVGWVLVLLGRGLRAIARATTRVVGGAHPGALASTAGVLTAVAVVGLVVVGGYALVAAVFARVNVAPTGLAAPASPLRSGGPGSAVAFDCLGAEGQQFVTSGPSAARISAYSGAPGVEPIRVYAGLDCAATPQARAALAVDELRRTGAFDRDLIVVAMTTGNGYLDPALVDASELLTGGDIATVSSQYSVLPSWLSFLVDQRASREEAQALWQAVLAAVAALPADARPRLAVSGESLGAFAAQAAFPDATPATVVEAADAAVWIGSPGTSALWPAWRDDRSAGPAWEPVIGDSSVARDPATAGSTRWTDPGWGARRIVMTQHANDPVSWWTPELIWQRPDWLDELRGPGVDGRMTWWPFVLFAQTGLDLAAAGAVPPGVGHDYGDVTAQAWAFALGVPGQDGPWSPGDTARLNAAIAGT